MWKEVSATWLLRHHTRVLGLIKHFSIAFKRWTVNLQRTKRFPATDWVLTCKVIVFNYYEPGPLKQFLVNIRAGLYKVCLNWHKSGHYTERIFQLTITKPTRTNSVAFSPQANYTYWETATFRWNLVPTFVDSEVSCGQHGGSLTFDNLSFLDRSRYFSFK
jgi:hypothetical protein